MKDRPQSFAEARSSETRLRAPQRLAIRQDGVVGVAIAPGLSGLERLDDGMAGGVIVRGRVAVRRVVAAPDMAAGQADAQVYPAIAPRDAFKAAIGRTRRDWPQSRDVRALRFILHQAPPCAG